MSSSQPSAAPADPIRDRDSGWIRLFDDRYGPHAFARLLARFEKPCVTYARIAVEFGVTRERVRQWHLLVAPDSPRGHERRRQCQLYRQKRKLLDDPLFRMFLRSARAQAPAAVSLIPAREGFRKRVVRLGDHVVVLKRALRIRHGSSGALPGTYALTSSRTNASFIFYLLEQDSYLFVPKRLVPGGGTSFLDVATSKYQPFRNRFAALAAVERLSGGLPGGPRPDPMPGRAGVNSGA